MLGGGGLRSQQHHARGRGHMQLHLKCTTSGAIVNYQSGGPSSAHDGGAAFLFAMAIARHVHSHLSQWGNTCAGCISGQYTHVRGCRQYER